MNIKDTAAVEQKDAAVFFLCPELTPTYDPYVFIEEEYEGYVRYRNIVTGRRWAVLGICDYRGDCIVGAINVPLGPRGTRLDVPVTPEFGSCCGKDVFTYKELEKVGGDNANF